MIELSIFYVITVTLLILLMVKFKKKWVKPIAIFTLIVVGTIGIYEIPNTFQGTPKHVNQGLDSLPDRCLIRDIVLSKKLNLILFFVADLTIKPVSFKLISTNWDDKLAALLTKKIAAKKKSKNGMMIFDRFAKKGKKKGNGKDNGRRPALGSRIKIMRFADVVEKITHE